MHRRTVLARLGAAGSALLAGCLSGSESQPADYEGDPADLVDVHEHGIPRAVGSELLQLDRRRLACVVDDQADADRVFDHDEVDNPDVRDANRAFVDETDFGSQAILQIEHQVPNPSYYLETTGVELRDHTLVVAYEDREDESVGGAPSAEDVASALLRVDVERGGVTGFELRHSEGSFEPTPLPELSG